MTETPEQMDERRARLVRNAEALLRIDAAGSLVPHGIGNIAREIIEALIAEVKSDTTAGMVIVPTWVLERANHYWFTLMADPEDEDIAAQETLRGAIRAAHGGE